MPNTMNAAVLHAYGEPLRVGPVDLPKMVPGHVLVRIEASGVNPLDTKIRAGLADHARSELPAILGIDLAGTVEATADDVEAFAPGDAVYGMTGGVGGVPGSLAQYAVVDARLITRRPSAWTARQSAAVPLAAITAWEGLVDRADVRAGQQVLIHGGAGGVGHIAVQLALALGADVYATGSPGGLGIIESYGATAIDYTTTSAVDYVERFTSGQGFDVVFDTIGGTTLDESFTSIRTYTGHVVSILGWGPHSLAPLSFRAASYSGVFTLLTLITGRGREHHGKILEQITMLADTNSIIPRVDPRIFDLETAHEAHLAVENGKTHGKIIIEIA